MQLHIKLFINTGYAYINTILLLVIIAALICLAIIAFDCRLQAKKYTVSSSKVKQSVRIVFITDLHASKFGKKQSKLLAQIEEEAPDIILLGGDMFSDNQKDSNTKALLAGICEKYSCYFAPGNHEIQFGEKAYAEKLDIIKKHDIQILAGDSSSITVNGEKIAIFGIEDPTAYSAPWSANNKDFGERLDQLNQEIEKDVFSILLSHRPEFFKTYADLCFDIVLCGHAHGGQWRLPYLINGLYAPHQGLFPKYAGGRYSQNGTTMIVSRGLSLRSTWIPRIFNRPELVIVDIDNELNISKHAHDSYIQ